MASKNQKYVTATPNSGYRIGHLLNDLMAGFILAEWHGIKYLHSPLPKKWEDFFGFGDGEELFADVLHKKRKNISIISCSPLLGIRHFSPKTLFLFKYISYLEYWLRTFFARVPISRIRKLRNPSWGRPCWEGAPWEYFEKVFADLEEDNREVIYCFQKAVRVMLYQVNIWGKEGRIDDQIYHNVIRKLREKYYKKDHPYKKCYFNPKFVNIAIHIRREDASIENQRLLPMSFYINIINQLTKALEGYEYEFHIYSYGSNREMNEIVESFRDLSKRVKFHLNKPAMEDIHHMIVSDILVTGHSSFSDWAGFLSKNIKLYHPHFHMIDLDKKEWIIVDDEGRFDPNILGTMLRKRFLTKTGTV